jgi:hypothetical protein
MGPSRASLDQGSREPPTTPSHRFGRPLIREPTRQLAQPHQVWPPNNVSADRNRARLELLDGDGWAFSGPMLASGTVSRLASRRWGDQPPRPPLSAVLSANEWF